MAANNFLLTWMILIYFYVSEIKAESKAESSSFDCSLIKESIESEPQSPESILEAKFLDSSYKCLKCGIVPSSLVNNAGSNAKFLIKWSFKAPKTVEIEFRLDSIEDYASLNYYYSIRKYNHEEFYSGVKPFVDESMMMMTPNPKQRDLLTNGTAADHKNSLLLNIKIVSHHYLEEFDQLKNAYIICTIIMNLKNGFAFTLPFMCVDVFYDDFYYEKDKVDFVLFISFSTIQVQRSAQFVLYFIFDHRKFTI